MPGCVGSKRSLAIEAGLAERMVAEISRSEPSVAQTDPALLLPPTPQTATEVREPPNAVNHLTLETAIAEALQRQPRLKAHLESIEQARQGENIALAPFLPIVSAGYSVGSYAVDVGGIGVRVPGGVTSISCRRAASFRSASTSTPATSLPNSGCSGW